MQTVSVAVTWIDPENMVGLSLPAYETELAAGMDVCAALRESLLLPPGAIGLVPTNLAVAIPEAVTIWGRDAAASMQSQVRAQDRNIVFAGLSRGVRLLTQVGLLGWGAYLALRGEITGGMVIAASIIAGGTPSISIRWPSRM